MIKACVIGWPISHSRSPLIHGYWLKKYGINGTYSRHPVEPASLSAFIGGLDAAGLAGCNVTIPHKEAVFNLVERADETTERLGAVNTVYIRDKRVFGTNTDGEGFINSLRQQVPDLRLAGTTAMVLGAGGASLAVVNAIIEQGTEEVVVANRTREKAEQLRNRFGARVTPIEWHEIPDRLAACSLLVNTTSLGMTGQPELDIDLSQLSERALVTDIVYTPLRTKLLKEAAMRGNTVVDGLGMLLHQAVRGFSLWFGVTPQVTDELHDLVARDIDPEFSR